jgi:hypothetical protein
MSRKSRLQDARVAKDKRAKRLAIGGGVVLALLLAWEVPHYLGGHKSAAPASTTTSTSTLPGSTTPTPTSGIPTTSATGVPPTTNTRLPNSDVTPRASRSQLFSFDHFASKNPFAQQAVVPTTSPTSGTPTGSSSNAPTGSPPTGGANYTTASSVRTLARTGSVTISVNGTTQTVRVGQSFPSANPLFKLVSVAHGVARIGIANGSYSSGAHTVSLTNGHSLTLVDTTDGARYVVRLIAS